MKSLELPIETNDNNLQGCFFYLTEISCMLNLRLRMRLIALLTFQIVLDLVWRAKQLKS